jgi:hypothetical protein
MAIQAMKPTMIPITTATSQGSCLPVPGIRYRSASSSGSFRYRYNNHRITEQDEPDGKDPLFTPAPVPGKEKKENRKEEDREACDDKLLLHEEISAGRMMKLFLREPVPVSIIPGMDGGNTVPASAVHGTCHAYRPSFWTVTKNPSGNTEGSGGMLIVPRGRQDYCGFSQEHPVIDPYTYYAPVPK